MVKKILAIGLVVLFSALILGCGDAFTIEQLVPWYVPYVKTTIDAKDLLPLQYRDKGILITRLTGPDAMDPTKTTSYVILAQDRSPDLPLYAIFDSGLVLRHKIENMSAGPVSTWFIDGRGFIQMGVYIMGIPTGITVIPPQSASAAWQAIDPVMLPGDFIQDRAFITDKSTQIIYVMTISIGPTDIQIWGSKFTPFGASLWSGPNPVFPAVPASNYNKSTFTSIILPALFPNLNGLVSINIINIIKSNIDNSNPLIPMAQIFAKVNITDVWGIRDSPIFCIRLPLSDLINGTTGNASIIVFDTSGLPTSSNSQSWNSNTLYMATSFTGDGFANTLPVVWGNSGSQILPMAFNNSAGAKTASMVLTMPSFPSAGSSSNNPAPYSSISQRPYYLTGTSDFIVVDGFHQQLMLCSGWWQ